MSPAHANILALDRRALELIGHDVAALTRHELVLPTPCDGWTVRDLVIHMNTEHAAICGAEIDSLSDPKAQFDAVAQAWLGFFETAGDTVLVPKMGTRLPTHSVLATHFADMLIHRWDLHAACGIRADTPAELLDAAQPIADRVTADASPLVGDHGVYKRRLAPVPGDTPQAALLRRFGRDPAWGPTT